MKKLSKLKIKDFHEMSDSEMRNVIGGYNLPGVTVYGHGPNNCASEEIYDLPTQCDELNANQGVRCRTADCKEIGQCQYLPFGGRPICMTGLNWNNGY